MQPYSIGSDVADEENDFECHASRFKYIKGDEDGKDGVSAATGEPEIEIEPGGGIFRLAKQPEPDDEKPIACAGRGGMDRDGWEYRRMTRTALDGGGWN
jgi:hypothetical protein